MQARETTFTDSELKIRGCVWQIMVITSRFQFNTWIWMLHYSNMASLLFPLQITHLFFAFPLPSYHLVVMFIDAVYLSFDIFITSERSSCIFSEAYLNLTSCHSLSFQSCSGARDKVSGALLSNTPPDLYLVWCTVWLGFIKSRSVWREISVFPESTATSYNTSQINQRQLLWRIALKYFSRFSIV